MASKDIDQLIGTAANPNAKIIVSIHPNNSNQQTGGPSTYPFDEPNTVEGFVRDSFGFSVSADYSSIYSEMSGLIRKLNSIGTFAPQVFNTLVSAFGGEGTMGQFGATPFAITLNTWSGVNAPSFNLDILFIALKQDDDPRSSVNRLLRCVLPESKSGDFMQPPLRPSIKDGKVNSGTVALQIGTWCKINNLFITSVAPNYSKVAKSGGMPLYADCKVNFICSRTPSIDEFIGWFQGVFSSPPVA